MYGSSETNPRHGATACPSPRIPADWWFTLVMNRKSTFSFSGRAEFSRSLSAPQASASLPNQLPYAGTQRAVTSHDLLGKGPEVLRRLRSESKQMGPLVELV